ncbi:3-hydroxyacyl-ACP dehydratase FabZ family protein [Lacticaseibacillus thailandensis]|uniref:Uncharacterized protein n=1 Tax=Lacticaseibacillus thailandensis DSM 22698 = JCM 13996 TaxID=1423810 RepID=A0A0R2CHE5_9LACO|nr:3-hydroxyacyl-ACP dehydratase FabZ family protein [Lacticaseibacillus thailandensis]KRM87897.1 hypothetical protein FD19_GL000175 [Lacticaseibacillus thailandensis DSM 22698 = JCM 13996]
MDATNWIPQRPPFLFIDRVRTVTPGVAATTSKLVTIDEWYFAGGNGGEPLMVPTFVLTEMTAQTGAVAILAGQHSGKNVLFGGIRQAEVLAPVRPGDEITCAVQLRKMRGPMGIGTGTLSVGTRTVYRATLVFAVVDAEE